MGHVDLSINKTHSLLYILKLFRNLGAHNCWGPLFRRTACTGPWTRPGTNVLAWCMMNILTFIRNYPGCLNLSARFISHDTVFSCHNKIAENSLISRKNHQPNSLLKGSTHRPFKRDRHTCVSICRIWESDSLEKNNRIYYLHFFSYVTDYFLSFFFMFLLWLFLFSFI
jgi:hypothetical protein